MPEGPAPRPQHSLGVSSDRLAAIGLMCLAVAFFSALDTAAKVLTTRMGIPVIEAVWARFICQFAGLLILVPALGIMALPDMFKTTRLKFQLVRSVLMVATTAFNFLALQTLRLDQTVTIVFLAPLVVALLAGPLLGEWVGWRRFAAIIVGFIGILIAVRPGFASVSPAVGYALSAMLAYALFMLLTRYISGADPPVVTLFYSMFVGTIAGAPFALAHWVSPPDWTGWVLLTSMGLFGCAGHYLFIHAYRLAPASAITPFLYTQILTMAGFGYFVFGDVPDHWTLLGAAIVVSSGVYLLGRERRTRRTAPEAV